jgi:hypothetical protein
LVEQIRVCQRGRCEHASWDMPASDASSRCDQVIVILDLLTPGGRFSWAHVKRGEARPGAIFFDPFWVGRVGVAAGVKLLLQTFRGGFATDYANELI